MKIATDKELEELFMPWTAIKKKGSSHYRTGGIEPIDMFKSLNILREVCLGNIIKYAFRTATIKTDLKKNLDDLEKLIHYAEILKGYLHELEKDRI